MQKVRRISPAPETDSAVSTITAPATKATNAVHADFSGDNASNDFPGPFTNPGGPRNLTVTFDGGWTSGNVVVTGLDQFGTSASETFIPGAGTTVVGAKVFASVSAARKSAVGAAANARIGTGDKLGLDSQMVAAVGSLAVGGVNEVGTWDAGVHGVTPTSLPNGARTYTAFFPVP